MQDTDVGYLQGIPFDDNFKYDYKFCEDNGGYLNTARTVLNIHLATMHNWPICCGYKMF
jgi:hypothetical protein